MKLKSQTCITDSFIFLSSDEAWETHSRHVLFFPYEMIMNPRDWNVIKDAHECQQWSLRNEIMWNFRWENNNLKHIINMITQRMKDNNIMSTIELGVVKGIAWRQALYIAIHLLLNYNCMKLHEGVKCSRITRYTHCRVRWGTWLRVNEIKCQETQEKRVTCCWQHVWKH